MIFIIVITFIIILFILIDLIPVYKEKQWLIFWAYTLLTLSVFISTLLIELDVKMPTPAPLIKKVVTAIWGLGRTMLF